MVWLGRIARVVAYFVSFVLLTVGFTLAHLGTPVGRVAVRDIANHVLAGLFRGRLVIGSVDHIGFFGSLDASRITLYDAAGHPIAERGILDVRPVLALWNAVRRVEHASFPFIRLHVGVLRLVPDADGSPTIATAFSLRNPAPPSPPPAQRDAPFLFANLHASIGRLESTLGGQTVTAGDIQADGSFITSPLSLHATGTGARFDIPQLPPVRMTARFDWDPPGGTHPDPNDLGPMRASAHLVGTDLDCTAAFLKQGDTLTLSADRCRADAPLLTRLSGQQVLAAATIHHASVTLGATNTPIRIAADGAIGDAGFEVAGSLAGTGADATVVLHGVDVSHIVANLPAIRLDGTARVARTGPHWQLDASQLHANVMQQDIPSFTARGTFDAHEVVLDALDAPAVGLRAHGHVALDGAHLAVLDATLRTRDVGSLPYVSGIAHGALDLTAHVERDDRALHARYHAVAEHLVVQGNHLANATVDGTATMAGAAIGIDAQVNATGVVIPGQGTGDVRVHVRGDPTRALDADVHAVGHLTVNTQRTTPLGSVAAPAPDTHTSLDGHVHVAFDPAHIAIDLGDSSFALRGAAGRIRAHVVLPRSGGRPTGIAHLSTEGGGEVDLRLSGSSVEAHVQRFDVAWVGRALGQTSQFNGTIEGDLGLITTPLENPHGTIDWRHGRLPGVGAFDLHVHVDTVRGLTSVDATLALAGEAFTGPNGAPASLHIAGEARLPREVGSADGWVRGIEHLDVTSDPLPLRLLEASLPHGARVSGNAALGAHIGHRATGPRDDLEFYLTADASDLRAYADVADLVPAALRGVIARSVSPRPLTIPLDARVGICGSINGRDLQQIPLHFVAVLGRDDGRLDPAPTSCDAVVEPGHATLLALDADVGPRWIGAATTALGEYQTQSATAETLADITLSNAAREALHATTLRANVTIGPLSASEWPFTDAAAQMLTALARPPIDGRFQGTITASGTLSEPVVDLQAQLADGTLPILVSRDEIGAQVHATLESHWGGSPSHHQLSLTVDAGADVHERGPHPVAGSAGTAHVQARIVSPLGDLLNPAVGLSPSDVKLFQVRTQGLRLGALRWARAHNVDGRVSLQVGETGDEFAAVGAYVTVSDLTVRGRSGAAAAVSAFLRRVQNEWSIQACVSATSNSRLAPVCDPDVEAENVTAGNLVATVRVPFIGNVFKFTPDLRQVSTSLAADHFVVDSLSPFIETPPILRVGGQLTGHVAWTAAAPCSLDASLQMANGALEIERIGQPATNVTLDLQASGRRGEIRNLAMGLSEGRLIAHGPLEFCPTNGALAHLGLDARLEQFPALVEGSNFANLTGTIAFAADVHRDHLDAQLHIDRLDVNLPEQASRSVQELDPHADVDIVGVTRFDPNEAATQPYPITVTFDAANPIWIRRDDVQVALRARGRVSVEPAGTAIAGQIDLALRQSYFEVFSKRFYLDRVTVHLEDPENPLRFNPLLDVAAHYDSNSTGRIDVTVAERLDNPTITFSSEQFAGASQSEILAMLVLGRRDTRGPSDQQEISQQAQQAAASLIAGFALGLGVSGATSLLQHSTRNLGFVPRLIAEPGADLGSSRFGGGITANRIYVEGTVGGASSTGSTSSGGVQGAEARLLVEWAFKDPFSLGGFFGYNSASSTSAVRFGVDLYVTP